MLRRIGGLVVVLIAIAVVVSIGVSPGPDPQPTVSPAQAAPAAPAIAAAPAPPAVAPAPAPSAVVVPAAVSGLGSFGISSRDLGIHSNQTRPEVPTGTLRLACYPTWRQMNPARGQFEWGFMDATISRAEAWGYRDILFAFCGTPEWAGGTVSRPDREVLGRKSTAAPRSMSDWDAFVTAVVKRYKGRITAYQAWNEGTANQFFQGTPAQLATMTKRLNTIVNKHDPSALVVSASVQQFNSATKAWGLKYLKQLKRKGWPVEVFSFHGYPPVNKGTNGRQAIITGFRKQLSSLNAPGRPIWDTEVTYKTSRAISGSKQGALVIRSYLDGWRMGVRRTYWYAWTDRFNPFGAIQMRSGYPAAKALQRFGTTVVGAKYRGCTESSNGLVRCRFIKGGKYLTIMWAEGTAVTVSRKTATPYQNLATGSSGKTTRIKVGFAPILVQAYV